MKHLFTRLIFVCLFSMQALSALAQGTSGTTVAGGNGAGSNTDQLNFPTGVAVDGSGNVYVADANNNRIQKFTPGSPSGITVAGGNGAGSNPNQLANPRVVFVDGAGNLYVADTYNDRIQKFTPGSPSGTTVAGGNGQGSNPNQLYLPFGVFVDGAGNVYVADTYSQRIQKWAPGSTSGITVAGGNGRGSNPNQLSLPFGVFVDGAGNVYVADTFNNRIQKWAPLPTVTGLVASPTPLCTGQPLSLTASIGQTSGTYSYTLTNGVGLNQIGASSAPVLSLSVTASGSGPQSLTLLVEQSGGVGWASVGVSVNPLPNAAFSGLSSSYCANAEAVTLVPTTAGGSFSGPGVSGTTFTPANAGAGGSITYSVTQNGCTTTSSQNVSVKLLPNASFSGLSGPYCANAGAVTLVPTTSGGTFSGPGVSGATFTPAQAGTGGSITYSVTQNGCTNTSSQTVTVNPLPNVGFTGLSSSYCANASGVTLTPTTPGGNFSGPGVNGTTFTPANAGTGGIISYSLTVNGCSNSSTQNVTVNALPTNASLSGGTLSCAITSLTLTATATGGSSFTLSNGQTNNTGQFVVNQPGSYTVTITNSSGCTAMAMATVSSNTLAPTATLTNNGPITCAQRSVTLTAGGGNTYAFSGGSSATGNTATVTNDGLYSVTVTAANGCTATQTTQVQSNTTAPTATLGNSGTITCTNRSVTLNAGGGGTYAFSSGATPNGNTATVTNGGVYSVTVTGTNGCTATSTTSVESNTTAPVATLTNNGPIADNNQTVTLTAGGGSSYAFSPGATPSGNNTATVTTPGAYSVTVTSANGCTGVASTTVAGAQNPTTVCRNGTAVLKVTATGNPVKYEWYKNTLNSARLADITNLQRGTATSSLTLINQQVTANYYVRVTDQNGNAVVYGPFKVTVNSGCITSLGRLAAEEVDLKITLLGNPLIGEQLRATISGAAGKALNVQLLDLAGKPVRSQQWQQAEANQVVEWNLGGQASGVYLLQAITDADGSTAALRHSLKVIKP